MRWASVMMVLAMVLFSGQARAVDVAVLPLAGTTAATERVTLTEGLRAEVAGLGVEVLSTAATNQVLHDAAALGGVCAVTVSSCAVQMGGVAGVRRVVVGAVEGRQLVVRVLDVASQREGARVAVSLDVPAALRVAAVRLLRPDLDVGRLAIGVDVAGAAVTVDGELKGTSPLPPLTLTTGRHDIYVTHVDHDGQSFTVDLVIDQTATLDVTLAPGQSRRRRAPGDAVNTGAGPIVVLDALSRPASPLVAAVVTTGLIESVRGFDRLVATPTDLFRLFGEDGLTALRACEDDTCLLGSLEGAFGESEVIVTDVIRYEGVLLIQGRRLTTGDGVVRAAEVRVDAGQSLAVGLQILVADLYPEHLERPPPPPPSLALLDQRLAPPPVPIAAFGVTAGLAAMAGLAAGLTLFEAGALEVAGEREGAATMATIGIVSASVAGVAAVGSIGLVPFVDWAGINAQNDDLLLEFSTRPSTRRHAR